MKTVTKSTSELKQELFSFIDNLPEDNLLYFYHLFIHQTPQDIDFWDTLSTEEQQNIDEGLADLEAGRFTPVNSILQKYE